MPLPEPPIARQRIVLAGATGLVGRALCAELQASHPAPWLHLLVRRPLDGLGDTSALTQQVVDFKSLPALPAVDEAYCALGTTIKVAGSEAAFRAVDFDAVLAFARAARQAGAMRLAVVSALGADAASRVFYNRVKGEMEQAVAALGFECVVFARPSLLLGDRDALGQPTRLGERIGMAITTPLGGLIPKRVRPIRAEVVARALIAAMRQARAGVRIVESGELQDLGR
jgi:uncharacterized protein YbjT (DUF2867 family)